MMGVGAAAPGLVGKGLVMAHKKWGLGLKIKLAIIPLATIPALVLVFGNERPSDFRVVKPQGPVVIYVDPKDEPTPEPVSLKGAALPAPVPPPDVTGALPPLPRVR